MNWTPEGSAQEYDAWIAAWRAFRSAPSHYHKSQMMEAYRRWYVTHNGSSVGLDANLLPMWENADRIIREARK